MGIQVLSDVGTVSKTETFSQIMFEIQKRMVNIDTNLEQKKPIHNDVADMHHLVRKLCNIEGVDSHILESRKDPVDQAFR